MQYGYKKQVSLPFSEAVEKMRVELAKEGFGILTEIDVKDTFKKKIDVDFDNYIILGACNPSFAHQALQVEKEIGLMLPCNVIVYEDKGSVYVSAVIPSVQMSVVDSKELATISTEVEEKLKKAVDSLG